MVDFNKYSEKEVYAAIRVVEEILDVEDFDLDVCECTIADAWRMSDDSLDGQNAFYLIDRQGAYLGDIGSDRFSDLAGVIDRTDTYHNDSLYNDYEERLFAGEEIPPDDWDRKILIFLESGYCQELLKAIDVETYLAYKDKELNEIGLNDGELIDYWEYKNQSFDNVGYVVDKAIAMAIMNTQSAYDVVEYNGSIYELYNNDKPGLVSEFEEALDVGDVSDFDFSVYNVYRSLVEAQKGLIRDDFGDIGLYDDKDNWQFYLSEYELEYIGLGEELEKMKFQYETEDKLVNLEEGNDKLVDELIADVVERSKATKTSVKNDVEIEK